MEAKKMIKTPELLAPAGNLEKLKVAVSYGANAVYLGGQKFGLRAASDNFTPQELAEGVLFAHKHGAKVYVVLNSFFHDKDFLELPAFLTLLESLEVDAVIVSDIGVVKEVGRLSKIPIHLSTQASCLNVDAALFWKKLGVQRIVLGRECSVKEGGKIKRLAGIEVEMFIHGSMCMAYSGNCTISNYTQGRDSNRGGCAHSCRFEYSLNINQQQKTAYFMSSKDLEGIRVLPEFIDQEIDSIKVEGRMKGHHYAGTISKIYSEAIEHFKKYQNFTDANFIEWEKELRKITHRDYTQASLLDKATSSSVYNQREHDENLYVVAGMVLEVIENEHLLIEVRSKFRKGDLLELLPFSGDVYAFILEDLIDVDGQEIESSRPGTVVKIPYVKGVRTYNILRKRNIL
ncbi:MAG: U32 family peptidase [Halobacteriovoraceae bacterium]|nr:U32 family peptidase [Halobacteriovoraceae bacterium]